MLTLNLHQTGGAILKISTVIGLLRRDVVSYGDYLIDAIQPSDSKQLKWINVRARLSGSRVRFTAAVVGPSGHQIWRFFDEEQGRFHYINSLARASLFFGGIRARGDSLASSYGLEQIEFRPKDLVIDIGANYADLLFYFSNSVPVEVEYVGIEPGWDEFDCMKRNCTGKSVTLFDFAVGGEDGTAIFYYSPSGANSSLDCPPFALDAEYPVEVRSIDSLLASEEFAGRRVRLLKVEAEGSEFAVLQGARKMLSTVDYIAVDMGFEKGIEQSSPAPEIIPFLLGNGFEIVTIGDPTSLRFLFRNSRCS
jgi:FkbM family methyltransferase